MNRIVFFLLFILSASYSSFGQKEYFIYLQSEKQQPFYVQFNNKNLSSSAEGYLILPKLTDGTYSIRLGFPNNSSMQDYDLVVKGDDAGYVVKNMGEGWGITDLQNGAVQMSGVESGKRAAVIEAQKKAEEKRITDSIELVRAQQEQRRLADSIQLAMEQQRVADSLLVIQNKKTEDSIKTATAAALEKPKEAPPVITTTHPVQEKTTAPVEQIVEKPIEKSTETVEAKKEIPEPPIANVVNVDTAVNSNIKPDLVAISNEPTVPEVSSKEQQRIADSLQILAERKKADSLRMDEANKEAQRKIEEAREIMRRTLGQTTPSASTDNSSGAAAKEEPLKKEPKKIVGETPAPISKEPAAAEKIDTVVVKIPTEKKTNPPTEKRAADPSNTLNSKPTPTNEPKFLDMEMGSEVSQPAGKNNSAAKKAVEPAEKVQKASPKKTGLTSNNANTKIVEGAADKTATDIGDTKATEVVVKKEDAEKPQAQVIANSNCKEEAGEKDFFNLRKKMAADDDPEEMLSTARKAFKDKCYSTYQVKNLCVLFLNDANKYRFLDIAYTHSTDPKNYKSLVELLSDEYYIGRFNAMIRE